MSTRVKNTNRREVLKLGASLAALGAAGTIAGPAFAQSKPEKLVISDGGGAISEAYKVAYYDTFTAKTGIPIVVAAYTNLAKLQAMTDAGVSDLDVMNFDATDQQTAARRGILEPIDWSLSDRSAVIPGMAGDYFIGSEVAAMVLAWNTDALPNGPMPKDWTSFFDLEKNKGSRGLYKQASQTLECVLMAAGVPGDKLYPLDVERALAALDKIKSEIIFWDSGSMSQQLLTSGEVSISPAWNGRASGPKDDGAPVDFTWDNSLLNKGTFIIPKASKNKTWAQKFIAHVLEPENQAAAARLVPYGPAVKSAYDLLGAERLKALPDPNRGYWQDYDYWAENAEKVNTRFNDWLVG